MDPYVHFQTGRLCELLSAGETSIRFLPGMSPHVLLQILRPRELPLANRASGQILPRMSPRVLLQISSRRELFIARHARKLLPRMPHHVRLQLRGVIANLITNRALVRLFPRVLPHVDRELRRMGELSLAGLAANLLPCVLAHVDVEVRGLREGLLADGAGVRPFARVRFNVRVEDVGAGEFLAACGAVEGLFTCVGPHVDFEVGCREAPPVAAGAGVRLLSFGYVKFGSRYIL